MDKTIESVMQTTSDGENTRVKSKATTPGFDENKYRETRAEQKAKRREKFQRELNDRDGNQEKKKTNKGWCKRHHRCLAIFIMISAITVVIAYLVGLRLCNTGIIEAEEICETFSFIGYGYSISPLKGPDVYTVFAEDLCSSNPCKNGGTCERVGLSAYTRCRCAARFSGPSCETEQERQPCEGEPCKNDAYCKVDENENEICICNPGFIGALCEEVIPEMVYTPESPDPCGNSNPCLNGGTCQPDVDGGVFFCDCPTGTSGTWCQNNGETTDQDQGNVYSKKTKKTTSSSGIWILVALAVVGGIVAVFFVAAAKGKDGKGKRKPTRPAAAFNY